MVAEQELTGCWDSFWLFSFKTVPQRTLLAEIVQIYLKCLKLPPPASLSQGHGNDQLLSDWVPHLGLFIPSSKDHVV